MKRLRTSRSTNVPYITVSEDGNVYVRVTIESCVYNMLEERGGEKTLWLTLTTFFEALLKVAETFGEESSRLDVLRKKLWEFGIITERSELLSGVFHRFADKPTVPIRLGARSIVRTRYIWWECLIPINHFFLQSIDFFKLTQAPVYIADFSPNFREAFLKKLAR